MVKIYYNRIMLGLMTLEEVPMKYRSAVEALLNK